jgi:transcriptional regulator with XRE-family HTH domain
MTTKLMAVDSSEAQIIADNIHSLMKAHNVSETQLARALGVSVMTIRRVVSGETEDPRISTLSLIASYFDVSVDSLLENNEMPINLMKKQKPYFVPIIDWESLEKKDSINFSSWDNWYPLINNDVLHLDQNAFALESKNSMQPRYPKGTLLIINPNEDPLDNDVVLIKSILTNEISLRELIIDSPKWILHPIILGSELIFYNEEEHVIIGVVVLSVLHARD